MPNALSGGVDSNHLLLAGRQAYKHYTSTAYRGGYPRLITSLLKNPP
jgi:hypothetical protein